MQSHRMAKKGFSLVEILVVIGIIAILIGILVPVLNSTRQSSQAIVCSSNLHQLGMAVLMYVNNHDGRLPIMEPSGSASITVNGVKTSVTQAWFGDFSASLNALYSEYSPLADYWGDANIGGCPTFKEFADTSRLYYGPICYAYSAIAGGFSGQQRKLVEFDDTPDKAMLWDSCRYISGSISRTPWGYPTTGMMTTANGGQPAAADTRDPNFHGRHVGGTGNVCWMDAHVSAFVPYYFTTYPSGGPVGTAGATIAKANHIGNIDLDGDQTTDECYQPRP